MSDGEEGKTRRNYLRGVSTLLGVGLGIEGGYNYYEGRLKNSGGFKQTADRFETQVRENVETRIADLEDFDYRVEIQHLNTEDLEEFLIGYLELDVTADIDRGISSDFIDETLKDDLTTMFGYFVENFDEPHQEDFSINGYPTMNTERLSTGFKGVDNKQATLEIPRTEYRPKILGYDEGELHEKAKKAAEELIEENPDYLAF